MRVGRPRKLVCSLGYAPYGKYDITVDGKRTKEYKHFVSMFKRCYDEKQLQIRPTYRGCTVDSRFYNFQDFAEWCNNQVGFEFSDWHLDKDILVSGNKIYSPENCCFVPGSINSLMLPGGNKGDNLPTGVYWKEDRKLYTSAISINSKFKHLGYFKDLDSAKHAYDMAKIEEIHRQAEIYKPFIDNRVYLKLMEV